jgi:hypothetical protein
MSIRGLLAKAKRLACSFAPQDCPGCRDRKPWVIEWRMVRRRADGTWPPDDRPRCEVCGQPIPRLVIEVVEEVVTTREQAAEALADMPREG